jgi:hypothetical protein
LKNEKCFATKLWFTYLLEAFLPPAWLLLRIGESVEEILLIFWDQLVPRVKGVLPQPVNIVDCISSEIAPIFRAQLLHVVEHAFVRLDCSEVEHALILFEENLDWLIIEEILAEFFEGLVFGQHYFPGNFIFTVFTITFIFEIS